MKRKNTLPVTLRDDLTIETLLRLPVRCLLRFKCVCKSWFSLISNPEFAKSHFDVAAAPTHQLLQRCHDFYKAKSIEIEALLLNSDSAQVYFNIPHPHKYGCRFNILGSCRGFILLTNYYRNDLFIWNPSTGLHRRIILSISMSHNYLCGIGYDSSTDDYMVVIGRLGKEFHYFSLRTNSWSSSECTVPYLLKHGSGFRNEGLFLNGALHWLVESYDNLRIIIAFDVMERRYSVVPLPDNLAVVLESKTYHLKVVCGCLCLYFMGYSSEMWVMKEYKVQLSWTKSYILSTKNFPLSYHFFPICFTKNGEILGSNSSNKLVRLNDKGELHSHGDEKRRFDYIRDSVMYRETLLSLPGGDYEKPSVVPPLLRRKRF
ncbi:F-box protein CPR1 [Glycine soja]